MPCPRDGRTNKNNMFCKFVEQIKNNLFCKVVLTFLSNPHNYDWGWMEGVGLVFTHTPPPIVQDVDYLVMMLNTYVLYCVVN